MNATTLQRPLPRYALSESWRRRLPLLPALLFTIALTQVPFVLSIFYSLTDWHVVPPGPREFVGLDNYVTNLSDSVWWTDFGTTMEITVITVFFEFILGFGFAFVMYKLVFGRGIVRTAILVPYAVITVVSAYAWQYAFATDSGFVNPWLGLTQDWFGQRGSALFVICLSEIWKTTPFISLLLLAGLAQVPEVLQEAAKVDGATWWQRLWRVTIPNMKAAIMVAVLFRTLDAFRIFDSIFIMTAGSNGTESVSFLAYRQTISRVEIGLGSAVSVLLFLCVVLIAAGFIKGFRVDLSQARGDR